MTRNLFALISAVLIVVSTIRCGANESLQNYEAELRSLKYADWNDVISKKSELDGIIESEKASIFKGNDEWEFEKGYSTVPDSYSKVFTLAETDITVIADIEDGKVDSISYELSDCTDDDALDIYNLIVDMYGEPDNSETGKGAIGNFEGVDVFMWIGEYGVNGMIYSPYFNTITLL